MNSVAAIPSTQRFRSGVGRLEVNLVAGQSAVTSSYASSPLKILVPRPRGSSVWAYLSSFGGGLLAGDEINIALKLGEGTRCFISTQASTKVYRNPLARPCSHRLKAEIEDDALLILAPDPVQAFAGSSYSQRQEFLLHEGGGLVLVDSFCSGRVARGERWAFNRLHSRNDVFINGERCFMDSMLLDPRHGALANVERMGRFNCIAMVLIIGLALRGHAERIVAGINTLPAARRVPLISTASSLKHGAVLRIAGESAEQVGREIHRHLAFVTGFLHDDPWSRKW